MFTPLEDMQEAGGRISHVILVSHCKLVGKSVCARAHECV